MGIKDNIIKYLGFVKTAPLATLNALERKRLEQQCAKMQSTTAEAYVWVYRPNGIAVFRAMMISGSAATVISNVRHRMFRRFWLEAFRCWNGDPQINNTSPASLNRTLERAQPTRLIEIFVDQESQ